MCGYESKGFKLAESKYHVWITKQKVLKLRILYIMSGWPKKKFQTCGSSNVDQQRRIFKIGSFVYEIKINKEDVLNLPCLFVYPAPKKIF